ALKQTGSERSWRIEKERTIGRDSEQRGASLSGGPQDAGSAVGINGWIDFLDAEIGSGAVAESVGRERFQSMHDAMSGRDAQSGSVHIDEGHHHELIRSEFGRGRGRSLCRPPL